WRRNAGRHGFPPYPPSEFYRLDVMMFVEVVGFLMFSAFAFYAYAAAAIGVLISEAFAIRSWMFHAANGVLSVSTSMTLTRDFIGDDQLRVEPMIVVAAGLAAGLAYWITAGWTAGF